jgi:hypothetical protein
VANPSLTVIKSFSYRGAPEEWCNTYHFDGGVPVDQNHWVGLANTVGAAEKAVLPATSKIVRYVGHDGVSPAAIFERDLTALGQELTGTFAPVTEAERCPGDAAVWIRWSTTQKTSRGKPIYLRNYFHDCLNTGLAGQHDGILAAYATALANYGNQWINGHSDGASVHRRAGPRGAIGITASVSLYITTRTLKRRG